MHPAKTELARTALAERDPALNPAERRLLILCDGKRPLDELTALLGPQTPAGLQRLTDLSFISLPAPEPTPKATPVAAPAATATARSRRSLAVAKIYMLDRLSLMRRDDADEMAAAIHAALHFIGEASGPRYARKLALQLRDTVPQPWDADMAAAIDTFSTEPEAG